MKLQNIVKKDSINVSLAAQTCILVGVFVLAIHSQIALLNYGSFDDEFETIVVSKMLVSGLRLYSDIFNQHGPLIFAFGLYLEKFVSYTVVSYRFMIAALQSITVIILFLSRPNLSLLARSLGITLIFTVLVCEFPRIYGHMFLYQNVAGMFIAIAMSLLVLPILIGNEPMPRLKLIVGGLLLGCLPFLAFTYAVASAGLILCALTKQTWRYVVAGVALALVLNASFIVGQCSISGLIVDHIYINLAIYPKFGDAGWTTASKTFLLAGVLGGLIVTATAGHLVLRRNVAWWRAALLVVALVSLLSRGPGFQASPFYYSLLPFVYLATASVPLTSRARRVAAVALILVFLIKASLLLPSDAQRIEAGHIPARTTFSELVRRYTEPSDRIISYSFDNYEYIASDRLPAAADFYFLPQQAEYDTHPILGVVSDPCLEIPVTRPKFVKLNKWLAWGKFPWTSYGACIDTIMRDSYKNVEGTQIYIRKDVWPLVDLAGISRVEDSSNTESSE